MVEAQIEEWMDIKGQEGRYMVSSLGRIKSLPKLICRQTRGNYLTKERILNPSYREGYARYRFSKKGMLISGHRIVALNFIPNPKNKPFINHINGIRDDNRVENLEWCTNAENVKHAYATGLRRTLRGGDSPISYITDERAIEIKNKLNEGYCRECLMYEYNLNYQYIQDIARCKKFYHLFSNKNLLPSCHSKYQKKDTCQSPFHKMNALSSL